MDLPLVALRNKTQRFSHSSRTPGLLKLTRKVLLTSISATIRNRSRQAFLFRRRCANNLHPENPFKYINTSWIPTINIIAWVPDVARSGIGVPLFSLPEIEALLHLELSLRGRHDQLVVSGYFVLFAWYSALHRFFWCDSFELDARSSRLYRTIKTASLRLSAAKKIPFSQFAGKLPHLLLEEVLPNVLSLFMNNVQCTCTSIDFKGILLFSSSAFMYCAE